MDLAAMASRIGKSIRVYLSDGDVAGIRHAEIVNWTGQALAFSRNSLADLKEWPEVRRQGVYFLVGIDEETGRDLVYIGEAEVVSDRLPQHVAGKDFWSECIAVTSKDENLTKSHIKYLESKLVALAKAAGRYLVTNSASPTESRLPRADRDAMDEFASNIRILLGVLGHRVLDPVLSESPVRSVHEIPSDTDAPRREPPSLRRDAQFVLKSSTLEARAIREPDALVILAESHAAKEVAASLSSGYRAVRDRLLASGVLVPRGDRLVFAQNHPFPSPSQAAAVVVGYMINGRQVWKAPDGRSLAEIEEVEAAELARVG